MYSFHAHIELTHTPPSPIIVFVLSQVLKLKTVVLVTHQVNMSAPYADKIVVLDGDGTIKEQGTYEVKKRSEAHTRYYYGVARPLFSFVCFRFFSLPGVCIDERAC